MIKDRLENYVVQAQIPYTHKGNVMTEKRNQEIRDFCEWEFPMWLYSRSKYAQSLPMNILAQFQPSKAPIDRDYDNSPLCAAFYLALMLKIQTDVRKATCFLYVFFPKARPKPVKWLSYELGINKDTVNEWAHETAVSIFRLARMNCQLNLMLKDDDFTFGE